MGWVHPVDVVSLRSRKSDQCRQTDGIHQAVAGQHLEMTPSGIADQAFNLEHCRPGGVDQRRGGSGPRVGRYARELVRAGQFQYPID